MSMRDAGWDDDDESPLAASRDQYSNYSSIHNKHSALRRKVSLPYTDRHSLRRPLIDQVSNKWRDEKSIQKDTDSGELGFCDLDEDESFPNGIARLGRSRRLRRMLPFVVLGILFFYYLWKQCLQPRLDREWEFAEGFLRQDDGTFGIAKGGEFQFGREKIADLDQNSIPGAKGDHKGKRRLIFVGDIHGCRNELVRLLDKVRFDKDNDHLIATGDVISKGPDSPGVLDELIRLGATSVRGNHEDRILAAAHSKLYRESETGAMSGGAAKDAALLKQLHRRHLDYLRDMPLILRIPSLPQAKASRGNKEDSITEEILVVHAGLVPALSLERQEPYYVMNMRSLHRKTHAPSVFRADKDSRDNKPWTEIWNWYNSRVARGRRVRHFFGWNSPQTEDVAAAGWVDKLWQGVAESRLGHLAKPAPRVVVFGHDSKAGLQLDRWSKGLDSGCVRGGRLTALVLDAEGTTDLVDVKCNDYKA